MLNALKAGKDKIIASSARKLLNGKLARYGELTSFSIDTTARTMAGQIALKGEQSVLDLAVGSYEVRREDGVLKLVVGAIHTSREWVNLVVEDLLAQRPELAAIEITDPSVAKLLEAIL